MRFVASFTSQRSSGDKESQDLFVEVRRGQIYASPNAA